jgi:poly(3-hydroxybutyrate) depolymerase
MTSMPAVRSVLAVLAILGSACSSDSSSSSDSDGGTSGQGGAATGGAQSSTGGTSSTGGVTSQGGTTATGGATQQATGGTSQQATGGTSQQATGGTSQQATGGTTQQATGGVGTTGGRGPGRGGTGTGGRLGSGGTDVGGASTSTGGSTTASGGTEASGGTTSPGGAGGSSPGGATGSGGGSGTGDVVPSAGCGKTPTLKNGTITLSSRKYILLVPDGYDNSHPYRLVLAYSWSGGSASDVVNSKYFTFATQDSKNTIFAAPEASNGAGSWSNGDVAFTDSILDQIKGDLCIDESRIFATGFSFGGGMAMALACTRAEVFRAVAFFSGADLTNSCPATLTKPIAYYASQASEDANGMDPTNPMTGEAKQAQFAAVNGCTAEPTSTDFPAAGQPHVCTNYKNCSAGHPTEYCVFNGAHGWEPKDPGQSTSWNAPEAWKFITQF